MRSETGTAGRVRIVIALAVAGAVTLMSGLFLVVVGVALQTVGKRPEQHLIRIGADVAVLGFAFGMIVLAILVLLRGGIAGPGDRGRQRRPAGFAGSAGRFEAGMAGAPGLVGGGPAGFGGPAGARWTAGGGPRPQAAGGPRAGAAQGGSGQSAPGRNGQRPPEANRQGMPGRNGARGGNGQPGGASRGRGPRREQVLNPTSVYTPGGLLDMPGSAPRGAFAQDQPMPGRPAGPGPGTNGPRPNHTDPMAPLAQTIPAGSGGPPAGPKWPASGPPGPAWQGRQPGPPHQPAGGPQPAGRAQPPGAEPVDVFTPRARRADTSAGGTPADMYVYRDNGEPEETPVPAPAPAEPDEHDAAYWYGTAEPEQPAQPEEEARGPFEPLVSSTTPAAGHRPDGPAVYAAKPDSAPADEPAPDGDGHLQKLEQIKDFYLTAEAIGEENVDKHFDQLLAQQRELISQYFKHSPVAKQAAGSGAPADPPAGTEAAPQGVGHDEATQAGAAST